MRGQFRELAFIVLIVVVGPILSAYHGSTFAAEPDEQQQAESQSISKHSSSIDAIDTLIDNFSGLDEDHKEVLKQELRGEIGSAIKDTALDKTLIIPLAGILFSAFAVTIPVFIVALVLRFQYKKRKQRMELINKYLESGQGVPKELLVDGSSSGQVDGNSNMKHGLLLMGVGVGLLLALGFLAGWNIAAIGLIPFFIGVARVVIWRLEESKSAEPGGLSN